MPKAARYQEPRWHAMVALIAVGGLRLALPPELSVGPNWLMLAIIGGLIVIYIAARELEKYNVAIFLGYVQVVIVTIDMTWSLYLLVAALPTHKESSLALLHSAAALWIT